MSKLLVQRKIIEILRILSDAEGPLGARKIGDLLKERGYNLGERAVRYHLSILDEQGFTKKHGYHGRTITERGRKELEEALVTDRLNFVMTRIESLIYQCSFDPGRREGDVIVNLSTVDKDQLDDIMGLFNEFVASGLQSSHIRIMDEGEMTGGEVVPAGKAVIATLCSITVDGVFLNHGIPAELKFGGVVRIKDGKYDGFLDYIGYRGTTIDPIKIFLAKKMTDITGAIRGEGRILANYREVPEVAKDAIEGVLSDLSLLGMRGWAQTSGGVVMYAGVNSIAYIEEKGIKTDTQPNARLMPFKSMKEV
ncbi:MAG: protein containing DUF128 [Candidatus Syntrophoarchaeum caldarius]|uniref:Protein containing DUF128 n=1 Tax=Candidatus Syntropharchaeum caldarium TaxID=1838285 RepID=A0A1F2P8Y4_9EURY|nr:MAG: protein containing DUF128 [Candidatus Syntrophoarchaeum caldarius]